MKWVALFWSVREHASVKHIWSMYIMVGANTDVCVKYQEVELLHIYRSYFLACHVPPSSTWHYFWNP